MKIDTGFSGIFVIMLIIALILDGISAILGIVEIFAGGLPLISSIINGIGAATIGIWLYFKGKKELKDNLLQKLLARIGLSSSIELIPIVNFLVPTWTINVLSVLEYRRVLYLAMIAGFILVPIFSISLNNALMPEVSASAGHEVSYPENADEQTMIDCINNYISKYRRSPYNGLGEVFVEAGKKYNIHPGYIVAIAMHETSLCTNPNAKGCLCYNGWGRRAGRRQPECMGYGWYAYDSWSGGIEGQTKFIKEQYYDEWGLKTVEAITEIYCPRSDGCDVDGYINLMISESEKAACVPLKSNVILGGTLAEKVITLAKSRLGTPYYYYNWGAFYPYQRYNPQNNPPPSFTCSGFTGWVYYWASDGKINMCPYSKWQYLHSDHVTEAQPGDLVLFPGKGNVGGSHAGIYLGNDEFIHASGAQRCMGIPTPTSCKVKISKLSTFTSYDSYVFARPKETQCE